VLLTDYHAADSIPVDNRAAFRDPKDRTRPGALRPSAEQAREADMTIEGAGVLVLLIAAILTIRFLIRTRRRRVPAALIVGGTVNVVCGLVTLGLALAHLVAIVGVTSMRAFDAGTGAYTLRFYWLFLLGVSVAAPGLMCVISAKPLTEGHASAWRRAVAATLWLLVVTVPLMPLNGFGTFLSAFALMNIGSLLVLSGRCGLVLRGLRVVGAPVRLI
jgi:hypothetical protein